MSEFEMMYCVTALRTLTFKSKFTQNLEQNIRTPEEKHHDQVVFAFPIGASTNLPGKKFVYAHIVAPHAHFFHPDGYISNGGCPVHGCFLASTSDYSGGKIDHCQLKSTGDHHSGDHGWDADHRLE